MKSGLSTVRYFVLGSAAFLALGLAVNYAIATTLDCGTNTRRAGDRVMVECTNGGCAAGTNCTLTATPKDGGDATTYPSATSYLDGINYTCPCQ